MNNLLFSMFQKGGGGGVGLLLQQYKLSINRVLAQFFYILLSASPLVVRYRSTSQRIYYTW